MKDIQSKKEWYKIFNSGCFNKTINLTQDEFIMQNYKGKIKDDELWCFRNTSKSGKKFICMSARLAAKEIILLHYPKSEYIMSQKAPDAHILVQGEYDGVHGTISFHKDQMRAAFKHSQHYVSRIQFMGVVGYENYRILDDLITECYPDHVVEFSIYDRGVGQYKKNMIIWEIRKY